MNNIQKYYQIGGALALEKVAAIVPPTLLGAGIGSGIGALFGDDALSGAAKGALIGGGIGLGAGAGGELGEMLSYKLLAKRIAAENAAKEIRIGSNKSNGLRHAIYALLGAAPLATVGGMAGNELSHYRLSIRRKGD